MEVVIIFGILLVHTFIGFIIYKIMERYNLLGSDYNKLCHDRGFYAYTWSAGLMVLLFAVGFILIMSPVLIPMYLQERFKNAD